MKKPIVLTGLMAAMMFFTTAYILHIPVGTSGGYIHLGDTVVYMAAVLLPTPYAMAAAAIGGVLADVLSGAAMWALPTAIIKAVMVIPFTYKKDRILCGRNLLAPIFAGLVCVGGYYVAEWVILMLSGSAWQAAAISAVAGILPNTMQVVACGGAYIAVAAAMDRLDIKKRLK